MIVIYFFLLVLLIGFTTYLVQKFRADKRLNRKFYDFGDGTAVVYTVTAMILAFIAINLFAGEPKFSSAEEKSAYGTKTAQPWLVSQTYRAQLATDSLNPDLMFALIETHYDPAQQLGPDFGAYNNEEAYFFQYLLRLTVDEDTMKRDFGNLFLGVYNFHKGQMDDAQQYLALVTDSTLKYYNNYLGRVKYYYHEREAGKEHLWKEIRQNGYRKGAYENLALLYDFEQDHTNLFLLTYNPVSGEYVPFSIRNGVYIRAGDVKNYVVDLFTQLGKNINLVGFSGALLILLVWMLYLMRVNIQRKSGWLTAALVVLFSAVLVLPVWLLYDFYEFGLGFTLNGEVWNDLLYCIFGIGIIEEFIKIVPFLIILFFTKKIKEPIDYIMYASLSALGFAFVENFQYFRADSLNIMHSRALTASITHMIDTSIVAYGLMLAKFRYRKSSVLYFCLFFLLAAVSHGFYDFWILNEVVAEYWLITFMYLLTSILIYASIVNNALNNSTDRSANIKLNTAKLSSDLAAGLVAIFLFEYICLAWIYGPVIGNRELLGSVLGGGYLIFFLSVRLSNIDVFPGEWYAINWFVGFAPAQIIYGDKRPNYNLGLGKRIVIHSFRPNGKLAKFLPVNAQIVRRVKIGSNTSWYLVKLDSKILFHDYNHEYVLVKSKNPVELFGTGKFTIAHFAGIKKIELITDGTATEESVAFLDWVGVQETVPVTEMNVAQPA